MAHGLGELSLGEIAKLKSVLSPKPTIGVEDFVDAIEAVTGKGSDKQLLRLVYDLIDSDGSGDVSWDELMAHIESLRAEDLYGDILGRDVYDDTTIPQPAPSSNAMYHSNVIRHVAVSRKAEQVITGADDGRVKLWSLHGLEYIDTLENGSCALTSMELDVESDTLMTLSSDQVVSIYNVDSRRTIDTFKLGKRSLADRGLADEVVRHQLRIEEASPPVPYASHTKGDSQLARMWIAQNNRFLQRVWARTGGLDSFPCTSLPEIRSAATAVAGCRSGSGVILTSSESSATDFTVFIGTSDGQVQAYNTDIAPPVVHSLQGDAAGGEGSDGGNSPRTRGEQRPRATFHCHKAGVTQIKCDRENECIYTASHDSDIHVCHAERGTIIRTMKGTPSDTLRSHSRGVRGIELCKVPKLIGSWGHERFAVIWDPSVAKPLHALHGHVSRIVGMRFSPYNDHIIVTYSEDKAIRYWDTRTYRCLQQIRERPWETHGPPGAVAYLAPSKAVVTCTHRMYSKLPKVQRFDEAYGGHTFGVLGVFYGAGNSLICSCDEESVRVWDCASAKLEVAWRYQRLEGMCLDTAGDTILIDESGEDVRVISTTNGQPVLYLTRSRDTGSDIRTMYDAQRQHWVVVSHHSMLFYTAAFDPRVISYPQPLATFTLDHERYESITSSLLLGTRLVCGLRDGTLAIVSVRDLKSSGTVEAATCDAIGPDAEDPVLHGTDELRSITHGPVHSDVVPIVHYVSKLILRRRTYLAKLNGIVAEELEEEALEAPNASGSASGDGGSSTRAAAAAVGATVADDEEDFRAGQELWKSRLRVESMSAVGDLGLVVAGTGGGSLLLAHAPLGLVVLRWRVTLRYSAAVGATDAIGSDAFVYGDEMGYCGVFRLDDAQLRRRRAARGGAPLKSDIAAIDWRNSISRESFFRASGAALTVTRWVAERDRIAIGSVDGCVALFTRDGVRETVLGVRDGDAIPFAVPSHAAEFRSTLAMFRKNALLQVVGGETMSISAIVDSALLQFPELFDTAHTVRRTVREMSPAQPERQFEALLQYHPGSDGYSTLQPKIGDRDRSAYQVRRPVHRADITCDTANEWDRVMSAASIPRQPGLLEGRAEGQMELIHSLKKAKSAVVAHRSGYTRAIQDLQDAALGDEAVVFGPADGDEAPLDSSPAMDDGDVAKDDSCVRDDTVASDGGASVVATPVHAAAGFDTEEGRMAYLLTREATDRTRLLADEATALGRLITLGIEDRCALAIAARSTQEESTSPLVQTLTPARGLASSARTNTNTAFRDVGPSLRPLPTLCYDEVDSEHLATTGRDVDVDPANAGLHQGNSPLRWALRFREAFNTPRWTPGMRRLRQTRLLEVIVDFEAQCMRAVTAIAPHLRSSAEYTTRALNGLRKLSSTSWLFDGIHVVHVTSPEVVAEHCLARNADAAYFPAHGRKLALAQLRASSGLVSVSDEAPIPLVPPLVCVVSHLGCTFSCTAVLDVRSAAFQPVDTDDVPVVGNLASSAARQCLSVVPDRDDQTAAPAGATVAIIGQHASGTASASRCVLGRGWDFVFPAHASPYQLLCSVDLIRQRTEGIRRDHSATLVSSRAFDPSIPIQQRKAADRESNKMSRKVPGPSVSALVTYLMAPGNASEALGGGAVVDLLHSFGINVRFIGGVIVALRRAVHTAQQHELSRKGTSASAMLQRMRTERRERRRSSAVGADAARGGARQSVHSMAMSAREFADAHNRGDVELDHESHSVPHGSDGSWRGAALCVEFLVEEVAARAVRDAVFGAMRTVATGVAGAHAPKTEAYASVGLAGRRRSEAVVGDSATADHRPLAERTMMTVEQLMSGAWRELRTHLPKFTADVSRIDSGFQGDAVVQAASAAATAVLTPLLAAVAREDSNADAGPLGRTGQPATPSGDSAHLFASAPPAAAVVDDMGLDEFWADVVLANARTMFPDLSTNADYTFGLEDVNLRRVLNRVLSLAGLELQVEVAGTNSATTRVTVSPNARSKSIDPFAQRVPLQPRELSNIWSDARIALSKESLGYALRWAGSAVGHSARPNTRADWAFRLASGTKQLLKSLASVEATIDAAAGGAMASSAIVKMLSPHSSTNSLFGGSGTSGVGADPPLFAMPTPAESTRYSRSNLTQILTCISEHLRLATLLFHGGERDFAIEHVRSAILSLEAIVRRGGWLVQEKYDEALLLLAQMQVDQSALDFALDTAKQMIKSHSKSVPGGGESRNSIVMYALRVAAQVESFSDSATHLASARDRLQLVFQRTAELVPPWHTLLREATLDIGKLLLRMEQESAALQLFSTLASWARPANGPASHAMWSARHALAQALLQLEKHGEALGEAAAAKKCAADEFEAPVGQSAAAIALIEARVYVAMGRYGQARSCLRSATATIASEDEVSDAKLECMRFQAQLAMVLPTISAAAAATRVEQTKTPPPSSSPPPDARTPAATPTAAPTATTDSSPGAAAADAAASGMEAELVQNSEEAFAHLNVVVGASERRFGPRSEQSAEAMALVGDLFARDGRFLEALQLFRMCEKIAAAVHGPQHFSVALHQVRAARCAATVGNPVDAVTTFREALASFRTIVTHREKAAEDARRRHAAAAAAAVAADGANGTDAEAGVEAAYKLDSDDDSGSDDGNGAARVRHIPQHGDDVSETRDEDVRSLSQSRGGPLPGLPTSDALMTPSQGATPAHAADEATRSQVEHCASDPPMLAFERHLCGRMLAEVGVLFLTDAMIREETAAAADGNNGGKAGSNTATPSGLEASRAARAEVDHLRAFGGSLQSQHEAARECFELASGLALQELSDLRHPFPALLRSYTEACDARLKEFADEAKVAAKHLDQRRVLNEWAATESKQLMPDAQDPLWYRKRLKVFKLRE